MVNFNFWDSYFGKKPKRFKKEARKQIEENTLDYLRRFGRADWIPITRIFEDTLKETDLFKSNEGNMWFASQGIKSKISSATHKLRRDGYPIISGKGHKGYRYADEDCEDFIDKWNEVFSANEERKENILKEKKTYLELVKRIIERLISKNRFQEAEELKKVLVKHQR